MALVRLLEACLASSLGQVPIFVKLLKLPWLVAHPLLLAAFPRGRIFRMLEHTLVLLWLLLVAQEEYLGPCEIVLVSAPSFVVLDDLLLKAPLARLHTVGLLCPYR